MPRIFISYRRVDSQSITGRIYDRLVARFGRRTVFLDVDDIPAGFDFRSFILDRLRLCTVVLVVIGFNWLETPTPTGGRVRRLNDPDDLVRLEIETALRLKLHIIPLFVGGAEMPSAQDLPASLDAFPAINGLPVRDGRDFSTDMRRVIATCSTALPEPIWNRAYHSRTARLSAVLVTLALLLLAALVSQFHVNPTPPRFPLVVTAPGPLCDHVWSGAYWSNRFGTTNCLTTYTRLTSQEPCNGYTCKNAGTLDFPLAAAHLGVPQRVALRVQATLLGSSDHTVDSSLIDFVLQSFLPATPTGDEYAIVLDGNGSYTIGMWRCTAAQATCSLEQTFGSGHISGSGAHTFAFRTTGGDLQAQLDSVNADLRTTLSPAQFQYVEFAVQSDSSQTTAQANVRNFEIQPV